MIYPPPPPIPPKRYHAFICYSSLDRDEARDLFDSLSARGYEVWFDQQVLKAGQSLQLGLAQGIEESMHTLALFSPAFFGSDWTTFEGLMTLSQNPLNKQRRLIPILIEDCPIPARLADFIRIDATKGFSLKSIDAICHAIS